LFLNPVFNASGHRIPGATPALAHPPFSAS
jgi:hypothetical protein